MVTLDLLGFAWMIIIFLMISSSDTQQDSTRKNSSSACRSEAATYWIRQSVSWRLLQFVCSRSSEAAHVSSTTVLVTSSSPSVSRPKPGSIEQSQDFSEFDKGCVAMRVGPLHLPRLFSTRNPFHHDSPSSVLFLHPRNSHRQQTH